MKIAIIPSHGSCREMFEKAMEAIGIELDMSSKAFRNELAEALDKLEPNCKIKDASQVFYDKLFNGEIKYLKYKEEPNTVFFKLQHGWAFRIKIEEVNRYKPWRISEYDGAESIEKWNPCPKIINELTGESEW